MPFRSFWFATFEAKVFCVHIESFMERVIPLFALIAPNPLFSVHSVILAVLVIDLVAKITVLVSPEVLFAQLTYKNLSLVRELYKTKLYYNVASIRNNIWRAKQVVIAYFQVVGRGYVLNLSVRHSLGISRQLLRGIWRGLLFFADNFLFSAGLLLWPLLLAGNHLLLLRLCLTRPDTQTVLLILKPLCQLIENFNGSFVWLDSVLQLQKGW